MTRRATLSVVLLAVLALGVGQNVGPVGSSGTTSNGVTVSSPLSGSGTSGSPIAIPTPLPFSIGGSGTAYIASSQSYTCPASATFVKVSCYAGEGAGGGTNSATTAGGSGGKGGMLQATFPCSGGAITFTIGTTATGTLNSNGAAGADATAVQGSITLTAKGGCAGLAAGTACGATSNVNTNIKPTIAISPGAGLVASGCTPGAGQLGWSAPGSLLGAGGGCNGSTGASGDAAFCTAEAR